MIDEERIRDYVRSRAAVSVPDDLRWPMQGSERRHRWAAPRFSAWARVTVVGVAVVALAAGILLRAPSATGPAATSSPAASGSNLASGEPYNGAFPSQVAGLPVVTVARAVELLQAGKLDGAAVAVAGYFDAAFLSCPAPNRYIGPLESWCDLEALADTRSDAKLCQPYGENGMECSLPKGTYLQPFFTSETSGDPWPLVTGGPTGEPAALVLIGHAGDPRQWRCSAATQGQCAKAFVVDRLAWANGQEVPVTVPQTGNQQTGTIITPNLTLEQVANAAGLGSDLLTAAPIRAGDIATIDPRWPLAGDNILWLVRSLGPVPASLVGADEARSETVWLVDDVTGGVIGSHPLAVDASYQPARWWPTATVHGYDCCAGNLDAFQRVQSADGVVLYEGFVSGSASGGQDDTTFGGAWAQPLVLPPGTYTVTDWVAEYAGGVMGTPSRQCSTQVSLRPLENVALDAEFPINQSCAFGPTPSSSP